MLGHLSHKEQIALREKEKILEVLQSQERVLTQLYERTFPPRQKQSAAKLVMQGAAAAFIGGLQGSSSQPVIPKESNEKQTAPPQPYDENDVHQLEREVEQFIRCGSAAPKRRPQTGSHAQLLNLQTKPLRATTAKRLANKRQRILKTQNA